MENKVDAIVCIRKDEEGREGVRLMVCGFGVIDGLFHVDLGWLLKLASLGDGISK